MAIRINGPKDVLAGSFFLVVGAGLFVASQQYEVGTAVSMGPGYFPALCGIAMALLGAGAIVKGLSAKIPNPLSMGNVEPLFLILASIISFGLLVERAGLVVATFVCIFFACLRRVFTNPIEVLLIFIVLTTFNVVVFVYALGIVIPVFWWDN